MTCSIAGFAGAPPVPPPAFPAAVEALVARLESEGEAVLVGHSFGASLAFAAALSAKHRTRAIVCVDGAPALGPLLSGSEDPARWERARAAAERAARERPDAWVAELVASLRPMFLDARGFEAIRDDALRSDAEALADLMGYAYVMDVRARMHEIDAPVLLITGRTSGPARDAALVEQLAGCARRAHRRVEGAAHFPMTEAPDELLAAIEGFLEELA